MKTLFYRFRNRTAAFTHDLLMVPLAWLLTVWLHHDMGGIPYDVWRQTLALLPLVVPIHVVMFLYFGLYRGIWRFASVPDFIRIFKAVLLAGACLLALIGLSPFSMPAAVPIQHTMTLLLLLCVPRFFYRWVKDYKLHQEPGARVLIVGAGRAGEMLVRDLLRDTDGGYQPIGFVDDDIRKRGTEVRGVRVVAGCGDIPQVVRDFMIELVFIAIPSATTEAMRRIVRYCESSGRPFRMLPPLRGLLLAQEDPVLPKLRDVSIEDLLGREPVAPDWNSLRGQLRGRRVLISGGGGSIGSELCRQVAALGPAELTVLERNEFNLYQIDMELAQRYPDVVRHAVLGDVCDQVAMDRVMRRHRPDVVFHAAAYKHVPLLEGQVREAIRNNLFGTVVLADAAIRHGCGTFVLISTDKAVNPTNVLGASKRLSEIYCQNVAAHRRAATRFVTVRFGNVLNSAGSVVPLFRRQIEAGGPVTVTHPEVTRYFMTIPEAAQLILQAGAVGRGGEIYVLDMGNPVSIRDLAEQMILLSGRTPDEDIRIEYTGLRPGEKLYEELFYAGESLIQTSYPKLLLAQHQQVDWSRFSRGLEALRQACADCDEVRIRLLVESLLPEWNCRKTPPLQAAAHG